MHQRRFLLMAAWWWWWWSHAALAESWPQFRGPAGRAVSASALPPISFGLSSNLLWFATVPPGNSSPVVAGERVFMTAIEGGRLQTLCFDLRAGRELWRRAAPVGTFGESVWPDTPGPATPTPATDGNAIFVFFGAYGVIAYDLEGRELWREPHTVPDVEACSSPILVGDLVIVVSDRERGSFVEARDKRTGRLQWRSERPQFRRSGATPFHWAHGESEEIVAPGSHWLISYDPGSGRELWRLGGRSRIAAASPTASENLLFYASSNDGRDGNWRRRNAAETVAEAPNPGESARLFEGAPDPSEDAGPGVLGTWPSADDWSLEEPPSAGIGLVAIRPGGRGLVSESQLAWSSTRSLPYAASPLLYRDRLFTVKDGGFICAYEAHTGRPIYEGERLGAPGDYYASPVAAADRVYFASRDGVVTVIDALSDKVVILARNELSVPILATPALVARTLIMRTSTQLFAFVNPP